MGGQACVLYGAAEFSKDSDFAVFASPENLVAIEAALRDLQAQNIAVPPFERAFLERGHAIHFRCAHPECVGMRVDIMAKMRGVAPFEELWERRTTFEIGQESYEVLGLPDLVAAKKTQRDKDWPMISRLMEAHYFAYRAQPNAAQIEFWFQELRTPSLLLELAHEFPNFSTSREAAQLALDSAPEAAIFEALEREEKAQREADKAYWAPLKRELEELRRQKRTKNSD